MDEGEFKPIAKQIFKEIFGLTLEDIEAQTGQRTPDFLIPGEGDYCLIELKIKGDDPAEIESINEELKSGEVVLRETPAGRRNRLDAIIGDGVDQMVSFDANKDHHHVLWLHCYGRDPDFHQGRFIATLYGTQKLVTIDENRPLITCYYFHNSSFYRYRNSLDGVILSYGESMQLCINTMSPRVETFRQSNIYKVFQNKKRLLDPKAYDGDEDMIVDSDIDRNSPEDVLDFLRNKYGLRHLQSMDLKKYEGIIAVNPPDVP